jgi:4-hydroxy-tetrahydrodipicolinate reductase
MKIALLGKGKTGAKVLELTRHEIVIFDSKKPPTLNALKECDVVISFLPGDAFKDYLELLMDSSLPVVTGSTGFSWPDNFSAKLESRKLSWIWASNFSLGIAAVKQMIQQLSKFKELFPKRSISIHEIHHTHKKDAPSGTALSMQEWVGEDCHITSERQGDVIGYHELKFTSGAENITLSHEALDRKLFAEGALWAAEYIVKNPLPGLHKFQEVFERSICN